MDIGRTDDGEGSGGAAALGDIGALKQAGAYVEQSRFVVGDVGAGHDPRRAPGRGALAALPAGAGYDGKVAAKVLLGVDHLGKLADGQGVASGKRIAAHKALHTGAQSCTLDDLSAQRVGAVQHHQPLARPGAILDEVGQRGEEGVVPAAYILYIIHQHIKSFQHGGGQPLGVFAIEAEHRQACGGVGILGDERPCRAVAPHTMFGAKQDTQVSGLLQGGNGGAAVTCAARGRSEPDPRGHL